MFARLPQQLWTTAMHQMQDPVVELRKMLYGEKRAGDYWARHFAKILRSLDWKPFEIGTGETLWAKKQTNMGRYVGDGAAGGPKSETKEPLLEIKGRIEIGEVTLLKRTLGIRFRRGRTERLRLTILDQTAYAQHIMVSTFEQESGGAVRRHNFPGMSTAEAESSIGALKEPGRFAGTAGSHLGSIQYLVRGTRSELAFPTSTLARKLHSWTTCDDRRLARLVGYIAATVDRVPVYAVAVDFERNIEVIPFSDSDLAGCEETSRSTSGWATFLKCVGGSHEIEFPAMALDWGSKRRIMASESPAEAETFAASETLSKSGLPVHDLVKLLLRDETVLHRRKMDNGASRLACMTGATSSTRYLNRTQRIQLSWIRDVSNLELHPGEKRVTGRCDTKDNLLDAMTKNLKSELLEKHAWSIGMRSLASLSYFDGQEQQTQQTQVSVSGTTVAQKPKGYASTVKNAWQGAGPPMRQMAIDALVSVLSKRGSLSTQTNATARSSSWERLP